MDQSLPQFVSFNLKGGRHEAFFKIILVLIALVAFLTGCPKPYYNIELTKVERPAKAKKRYGVKKITKIKEEGVEKYHFEDEMVDIRWWIVNVNQIWFKLTNKTNHSIKIIWDEAAFVDYNGLTHRVMHKGVKYVDRNDSQPPSVIVRNGTISDLIVPTENVYFVSGPYGGYWEVEPFFPTSGITSEEAQKYIGKTIQILLPLQIEGVVNEYIFIFEVENVKLK